ncbi:unnamed protein product [Ixodes persulcatus]
MNELLGWYGYEKAVDSRDTQGLNLTHFAPSSSDSGREDSGNERRHHRHRGPTPHHRHAGQRTSSGTADEGAPATAAGGGDSSPRADGEDVALCHSVPFSSILDSSRSPPNSANLPPNCILCAWCQKVGMKLFTLKTTNGSKTFCSELCFTQCRRASFKKNKVCDWCKHVRHTVNYVDFQDGEQQLQFCSDKCLNQYKMNIFCRETQAHLQMHPHLQEAACKAASGLITPELWLRDCKTQPSSTTANGHDTADEEEPDERSAQENASLPSSHNHQPLSARSPPRTASTPLSTTSSNMNGQQTPGSPPAPPPPPPPQLMPPLSLPGMPLPDSARRPPFLPPHPAFHMLHQMRMHHHNASNHDSIAPGRSFLPPPPGLPRMGLPRPPLLPLPAPNPLLPPPTVMVPYPIFLPIPIPIPIPIPLPFKDAPCRDVPRRPDAEVRDKRRRRVTPEHDDMRDSVDTEDDEGPRTRPVKSSRRSLNSVHLKISRGAAAGAPLPDADKRLLDEDRDLGRDVKRKCTRN